MPELFNTIKQKTSLRTKIVIAITISMLVITMGVMGWSNFNEYERDLESYKRQLSIINNGLALTIAHELDENNLKEIKMYLKFLEKFPDFVSTTITNERGDVIYSIHSDKYDDEKKNLIHTSSPVVYEGKVIGNLSSEFSKDSIIAEQKESIIDSLISYGLLLAMTIVVLYYALYTLVIRPIQLTIEDIEKIKRNGIGEKIVVRSDDELGVLASALNSLTNEVIYNQQRLTERTEILEKMNSKLHEAKVEADNANKSKSLFIANMSHELRTPLNAIIGYSEMLIEDAPEAKATDAIPDLYRILASAKHLLSQINDILDISKIESGKMLLNIEEFGLFEVVDTVKKIVEPLAKQNKNMIRFTLPSNDIKLRSDSSKIKQILINLISNALKFTQAGKVTIDIVEKVENDNEYIEFKVKDSGIGMTKSQLAKIFQPFTQADAGTTKKFGGTGLGLSITKSFVSMLGGEISVESEVGDGSTFIVTVLKELNSNDNNNGEAEDNNADGNAVDDIDSELVDDGISSEDSYFSKGDEETEKPIAG